jgi:hypothetical protein
MRNAKHHTRKADPLRLSVAVYYRHLTQSPRFIPKENAFQLRMKAQLAGSIVFAGAGRF